VSQLFQLQTQTTPNNNGTLGGTILDTAQAKFDDVVPVVAIPSNIPGGFIDVVRDFPWTGNILSKYQIDKTPYIMLHEYDMTTNSAVSTFLYYLNLIKQTGVATANTFNQLIKDSGAPELITSAVNEIANSAVEAGNNKFVENALKQVNIDIQQGMLKDPYLQPYNLLYLRKPTNFKYVFPYMSPERSIFTSFGDSPSGLLQSNPLGEAIGLNATKNTIEQYASLFTVTSPGAFIESPKYYNFGSDEETYDIKFPLINTRDRDTYQKNFELIFLLFYQNRAFRRSISRVIPPKIYSALIPGITELPFCYINRLQVKFLGNRRNVTIRVPTPTGKSGELRNCIIPDAYEVSITLKSLLEPTSNMMLSNELNGSTYREDPMDTLLSIRRGLETQGTPPVLPTSTSVTKLRTSENSFVEDILTNRVISVKSIQNLNRLQGLI